MNETRDTISNSMVLYIGYNKLYPDVFSFLGFFLPYFDIRDSLSGACSVLYINNNTNHACLNRQAPAVLIKDICDMLQKLNHAQES